MFTCRLFQTRLVFGIFYLISGVSGFNGRCPSGWIYFQHYCYRLERTLLSFAQAQTSCESAGANLVSITNAEENSFVTDLGMPWEKSFYIGLNDVAREGTFRWTDGTPFRYNGPSMSLTCPMNGDTTPAPLTRPKYCKQSELDYSRWNIHEPNNAGGSEDCIHIVIDVVHPSLKVSFWNDIRCSHKGYSMCKKDASEEGTVDETTIKCPRSFETFIELATPVKSVTWSETAYIADSLASHVERSHSPGDELPKGVTLVNYTFRDANNDLSLSCNFSITVIEADTIPPSIQGCPSDVTMVKRPDVPLAVDWIPPTASDLSGNVTLLSQSHTPGTIFDIGVHSVRYKFADNAENEAECFFRISVFGAEEEREEKIPSNDDSAHKQARNSDDRNLISGLYVLVIVIGLSVVVMLLLLLRNRNKTRPFVDSRSYSKMDEENLTN